jgi:hypothetical protein
MGKEQLIRNYSIIRDYNGNQFALKIDNSLKKYKKIKSQQGIDSKDYMEFEKMTIDVNQKLKKEKILNTGSTQPLVIVGTVIYTFFENIIKQTLYQEERDQEVQHDYGRYEEEKIAQMDEEECEDQIDSSTSSDKTHKKGDEHRIEYESEYVFGYKKYQPKKI